MGWSISYSSMTNNSSWHWNTRGHHSCDSPRAVWVESSGWIQQGVHLQQHGSRVWWVWCFTEYGLHVLMQTHKVSHTDCLLNQYPFLITSLPFLSNVYQTSGKMCRFTIDQALVLQIPLLPWYQYRSIFVDFLSPLSYLLIHCSGIQYFITGIWLQLHIYNAILGLTMNSSHNQLECLVKG